jgi:hypothetical protein
MPEVKNEQGDRECRQVKACASSCAAKPGACFARLRGIIGCGRAIAGVSIDNCVCLAVSVAVQLELGFGESEFNLVAATLAVLRQSKLSPNSAPAEARREKESADV